MTPRTDAHRPSAIVPDEYAFIGVQVEPSGACDPLELVYIAAQRRAIEEHRQRLGARYENLSNGGCAICGNVNVVHYAVFHHRPRNVFIRIGFDCADKLHMGQAEAFRTHRKRWADILHRKAGKAKARLTLQEAGLDVALRYVENEVPDQITLIRAAGLYCPLRPWPVADEAVNRDSGQAFRQRFDAVPFAVRQTAARLADQAQKLGDMVRSLIQYGNWSDAQLAFARRLNDTLRQAGDALRNAEADAEKREAEAVDVPTGRIDVAGEVLSVRPPDQMAAFPAWKMLVQDERGFRLWGTVPRAADEPDTLKGKTVRFTATVERGRDKGFGFFKRPSKLQVG